MQIDFMRLAGAPLLISVALVMAATGIGGQASARYGSAWPFATGVVVGLMAVSGLLLLGCLDYVRHARRPALRTWLAKGASASSRLTLALSCLLAVGALSAVIAGP